MYVDLLIWVGKPVKERAAVIMVETSRAGVAPPLLTAGRVSFNSHPRGRPPRMFQLKSLGCDDEPRPVALPAASSCQQLPAPLGMILGMILQRFFGLVNWKTVCELENHGKSPCYSWENSLFRAMFNRYVSHYQRVNHMILGAPAQLMLLGHPFSQMSKSMCRTSYWDY